MWRQRGMAFRHSCGGEAATGSKVTKRVEGSEICCIRLILLYSTVHVQAFVFCKIRLERELLSEKSLNNFSIHLQAVQIQRITSSLFPVLSLAKQLQELWVLLSCWVHEWKVKTIRMWNWVQGRALSVFSTGYIGFIWSSITDHISTPWCTYSAPVCRPKVFFYIMLQVLYWNLTSPISSAVLLNDL